MDPDMGDTMDPPQALLDLFVDVVTVLHVYVVVHLDMDGSVDFRADIVDA
jgi:hypothetical protein